MSIHFLVVATVSAIFLGGIREGVDRVGRSWLRPPKRGVGQWYGINAGAPSPQSCIGDPAPRTTDTRPVPDGNRGGTGCRSASRLLRGRRRAGAAPHRPGARDCAFAG